MQNAVLQLIENATWEVNITFVRHKVKILSDVEFCLGLYSPLR